MTHLWVLISGFIFANFMCLIAIWNNYNTNSLEPKFISSSYDPHRKEELDSLLLKSIEKKLKNYFNIKTSFEENLQNELKQNSTFFLGESLLNPSNFEFKEKIKNYQTLKNSDTSKFSIFLDKEKKNLQILKISNEGEKLNKFETKTGEVILYTIPLDNFIVNGKKENLKLNNFTIKKNFLENSLIKECWSTKFFGRIIGAVASADRKKLSIFYRVVKGHTISYRIRYFHDINCLNGNITKSENILQENFDNYMEIKNNKNEESSKNNENYLENYFEITEEKENNFKGKINDEEEKVNETSSNENNNNERKNSNNDKVLKNYFNDLSYDDFLLKGNTPITAMAIKEDILAYSRDLDFRQYYILKREKQIIKENSKEENDDKENKTLSKTIWKVSSLGPKIDRKISPFFHTNSLKFIDDKNNDYRLIHIFISINTTDISAYGNFRISNHTDFTKEFTDITFTSIPFFKVMFIDEIIEENEEFTLEKSIKKLKHYLQPTLYSNNFNSKDMIFEFAKSYLLLIHNNSTSGNVHFMRLRPDLKEKIQKIHSDLENENVVIVRKIKFINFTLKEIRRQKRNDLFT